ncbi:hypothetical protein [Microcoleus vaginatus]|uniref:hypothetical protein n=1 Tax=Microcoleus vaginatus TaxID=119532 RepID=UPI0002E3D6A2
MRLTSVDRKPGELGIAKQTFIRRLAENLSSLLQRSYTQKIDGAIPIFYLQTPF